ncbi:MAG: hypothetical protein QM817_40185 [Archangium sp.]
MKRIAALVVWSFVSCTASQQNVPPPRKALNWECVPPDASEEGVLACRVVSAMLEQARLAKEPPARVTLKNTEQGFSATVELDRGTEEVALPLAEHVYSPDTWVPLVPLLFREPQAMPDGLISYSLVRLGTDISASTLGELAAKEQARLEAMPRASPPRFGAALLLAVMAWREGGPLVDPREFLTLATAQLAIGTGLVPAAVRHPLPTGDGNVARVLIELLVSSDEAALRRRIGVATAMVASFRTPAFTNRSVWLSALDGNWKQPVPPNLGALEKLVRFHVLAERAGTEAIEAEFGDDPVFARVLFASNESRPVPVMRMHAETQFELEAAERAAVEKWISAAPAVIPEAAWKRHLTRNAMSAALMHYRTFAFTLNLPDEAERIRVAADEEFKNEPLWGAAWLLRDRGPKPRRSAEQCAAARAVWTMVNPRVQMLVREACGEPLDPLETPRGTAYDADSRFTALWLAKPSVTRREAWLALAPFAFGPRLLELRSIPRERLTTDRALDVMGPLVKYDVRAMEAVGARVERPGRELLEAQCEAQRANCGDLVLFLRANRLPEYVNVLERWRSDPGSRVAFSNFARPLLDFYFEQKRLDDARALVDEVYETRSGAGFKLKAIYLERTGKFRDAESVLMELSARYGSPFHLDDFYLRAAGRKYERGAWAAKGKEAAERLFGGSPPRVTTAALAGETRGASVSDQTSPPLFWFGFRKTDVVLALDGIRVKTTEQMFAVLHLTEDKQLKAVVLRDGAVVELSGEFVRERYGK